MRNRAARRELDFDDPLYDWPSLAGFWIEQCGLSLGGKRMWVHEVGWTPLPHLIMFLLTGKGGVGTNVRSRVDDRYTGIAVHLAMKLSMPGITDARKLRMQYLSHRKGSALTLINALKGKLYERCDPSRLDLDTASIDLAHSAGVLQSYPREVVEAFARETFRVLKPDGLASHLVREGRSHRLSEELIVAFADAGLSLEIVLPDLDQPLPPGTRARHYVWRKLA